MKPWNSELFIGMAFGACLTALGFLGCGVHYAAPTAPPASDTIAVDTVLYPAVGNP